MPVAAVMRPKLPAAARIAPYLERIDAARTYSNFGPLNSAFEDRLCERFGVTQGRVTTVTNATLGLALALEALGAPKGAYCAMPAWTFVASPHAAVLAGLIPYFVDVDAQTWALDPNGVALALAEAPGAIGAVMPVAPFGSPIDGAGWDHFVDRTGIPVVIDAAAGYDSLVTTRAPAVVSLHATKVLGVGEGGFVISSDEAVIKDIRARSSFGFQGSRNAAMAATNAKLSEFHAAVGLAGLDEWDKTRAEWMHVAELYRRGVAGDNGVGLQPGFGESWIGSTCLLTLPPGDAARAEAALAEAGVETRQWWGEGAHRHSATTCFPRTSLTTTETLVSSTLGVPFYRDLPPELVDRVLSVIHEPKR